MYCCDFCDDVDKKEKQANKSFREEADEYINAELEKAHKLADEVLKKMKWL